MTTTPITPAVLTTQQAAIYLGISKSSLARLRSSGRSTPRAVKIGGALRYRQSDLDAWIEAQLEPAA